METKHSMKSDIVANGTKTIENEFCIKEDISSHVTDIDGLSFINMISTTYRSKIDKQIKEDINNINPKKNKRK